MFDDDNYNMLPNNFYPPQRTNEEIESFFSNLFEAKVEVVNYKRVNDKLYDYILSLETFVAKSNILLGIGVNLGEYYFDIFQIIEDLIAENYGEAVLEMILWYLFDRIDRKGKIVPFIGEDKKEYLIKDVDDLYYYIKNVL